jgi:pimeloyl-ACP methyl ester carboxylesterase
VILVNGNETRDWQVDDALVIALANKGYPVFAVDCRGVGSLRPNVKIRSNHTYTDPLESIEANLAANAFLVGKSLAGMRVTDVRAAVKDLAAKTKATRIVLIGRKDGAMTAVLTAAIEPAVTYVAVEGLPLTMRYWFDTAGHPLNGATVVPGLLRDFGDVKEILAEVAPRRVMLAAPLGTGEPLAGVDRVDEPLSPERLTKWLVK